MLQIPIFAPISMKGLSHPRTLGHSCAVAVSDCVALEADAASLKYRAQGAMLVLRGGHMLLGGGRVGWYLGSLFHEVFVSNTIIYSAMEMATFLAAGSLG